MKEEQMKLAILNINGKVGEDLYNLNGAYILRDELERKKTYLSSCLNEANQEVPTKLHSAITKAQSNSKEIDELKLKSENLKEKVESFLRKTEPLRSELGQRIDAIKKLEGVLAYLKSFEKIEDLCSQLKQCTDDEQAVLLYGEIKEMCKQYTQGHRAGYVKDYTHYWHNVLKDKLAKQYEDVLKVLKWPFSSPEGAPPPKEVMLKFSNLTRYLFLIQEPEDLNTSSLSGEFSQETSPCLPVRILLRPLKKRFSFHFTGSRQTARIDRPEWFFTQTLTWIKTHQEFVEKNVQPVADKLEMMNVNAVDEFNAGLIALAAERLYTVLGIYNLQNSKGAILDVDAAFAHAVDETLGFHKELVNVTGNEANSVLTVLTKAEIFVKWLSVEKKYALSKMDETLESEQWSSPLGAGVGAAVGALLWVPRGAEWFVLRLKTIEDRYAMLPQPGHRLQFLELQLDLVEEWRVRLTQLLSAAINSLEMSTFLSADASPHPVTAVINAAHYTRSVLLQWAHSLHYLQLYFYRRQFQHFTHQQHHDDDDKSEYNDTNEERNMAYSEGEIEDTMLLKDVEVRARKLALNEVTKRSSMSQENVIKELNQMHKMSPVANLTQLLSDDTDESGVFAEAPALLARLRDAGMEALEQHILLEFKAMLKDYRKQKWHAMPVMEQRAVSVSGPLCRPLGALAARLAATAARLAPALHAHLRAQLAARLDDYVYQEVVLESLFNPGGTMQFTHDVKRNIIPTFAPPNKVASQIKMFCKLLDSCKLLNMDYDDARRLRSFLTKNANNAHEHLSNLGITKLNATECFHVLGKRTDFSDTTSTSAVMDLF